MYGMVASSVEYCRDTGFLVRSGLILPGETSFATGVVSRTQSRSGVLPFCFASSGLLTALRCTDLRTEGVMARAEGGLGLRASPTVFCLLGLKACSWCR